MIWKAKLILCLALHVSGSGLQRPATSEQRIKRFYEYTGHHGDLAHIGHHEPEHHEAYAWTYPSYEFSYSVNDHHTHDHKGQYEIRDGDKVTGNYWLIQPDGYKRVVDYHADHKSGFHADVKYLPVGHHNVVNEYLLRPGDLEIHAPVYEYNYGYNDANRHARKRENRDGVVGSHSEKLEDWNKRHRDELYGQEYGHLWARQKQLGGPDQEVTRDEIRGDNYRLGYDEKQNHAYRRPEDRRSEEIILEGRGDEHPVKYENRGHEGHLWGIRGWLKSRNDQKYVNHGGLKYEIKVDDGKENRHPVLNRHKSDEGIYGIRLYEKNHPDHKYDSHGELRHEIRVNEGDKDEQIGHNYGIRLEKEQPSYKNHRDGAWRQGQVNKEHWKHGVMVGWNEGKGLNAQQPGDNSREHEYHRDVKVRPNYRFKPLIPYGLEPSHRPK